uniref:ABC transporter domain-containing protein n=1 Tax=Palpitomonas bilix TaxID=652834 RepID=A0A7S3G9R0_9EUKA
MAFGRLRALGNALHLKSRHGKGYRLSINTAPSRSGEVIEKIKEVVSGASVVAENAGSVAVNIPGDYAEKVPEICESLGLDDTHETFGEGDAHQEKGSALVHEWSLSLTTLEDVFLEVTRKSNFVYGRSDEVEHDEQLDAAAMEKLDSAGRATSSSSNTFRGLFRKNFSLQSRQKGTNCCQIVSPVLVLVILVLLQVIITAVGGPDISERKLILTLPFPLNIAFMPDFPFFPSSSSFGLSEAEWPSKDAIQKYGLSEVAKHVEGLAHAFGLSHAEEEMNRFQGKTSFENFQKEKQVLKTCLEFFYFVDATTPGPGSIPLGFSFSNGSREGLLSFLPQKNCSYPAEPKGSGFLNKYAVVPYFERYNSTSSMQETVFEEVIELNKIDIDETDEPPYLNLLPDAYVTFFEASSKNSSYGSSQHNIRLKYSFAVNDNPTAYYHRPNNFTRIMNKQISKLNPEGVLLFTPAKMSFMDLIIDAFYKSALPEYAESHKCLDGDIFCQAAGIKFAQAMPFYKSLDILAAIELFGSFLYPLALSLQLPIYVYIICLEKEERLREMMKSMGMKMWKYWVANYVYNFSIYGVVVIVFALVATLVRIRFFTETNPLLLFFLFLGWGLSLVSLSFLIGSLLNSKRAATIMGYVVALLGNIICIILCAGIYGKWSFAPNKTLPLPLLLYNQMGFARAIYLINYDCSSEFSCPSDLSKLPLQNPELVKCIISLYVDAIWYLIAGLYLDAVLPGKKFGVAKHPCFCCLCSKCRKREKKATRRNLDKCEASSPLLKSGNTTVNIAGYSEDQEVATERKKVAELSSRLGEATQSDGAAGGIYMNSVSKNFKKGSKKSKLAVDNVSLAVPRGMTFGLLGENGAGKTTTINMLTGVFPPTSGTARVCGYDIVTDVDAVHFSMGVCPQFDLQWADLTVEEHILFYARLKGIPAAQEKGHVQACLESVGLYRFAQRKSSKLSGGMRRRLSVAISLVGHSSIVLLDEPTTGLDPASRRNLWSIIQNAKGSRVILLTTHALDEAELLCDRLAIMVKGRVKALGSPEGIKGRYGSFLRVLINFRPTERSKVIRSIIGLFPGSCTDVSHSAAVRENMADKMDHAFTEMEEIAGTACIFVRHRNEEGSLVMPLAGVFRLMTEKAAHLGVKAWGVSMVSLEDVFQDVVEEDRRERRMWMDDARLPS